VFNVGLVSLTQPNTLNVDKVLSLLSAHQYVQVVELCDSVLAENKEDAFAYYYRGAGKLAQGYPDKALNDFTRALTLKEDYDIAYLNRGKLYLKMGEWSKALEDLNTYLSYHPEDKDASATVNDHWL
jgi:tetratricopeptide (TPR) repeat protein